LIQRKREVYGEEVDEKGVEYKNLENKKLILTL
jgi:hypothetical protein